MRSLEYHAIPHETQRYATCGDFFTDARGVEQFRVSIMHDVRYEHLVLVHELLERILCYHRCIENKAIDAFDMAFEERRERGLESETAEPGDDPQAPYYREHQFASLIERLLAYELGVNWKDYDRVVNALGD